MHNCGACEPECPNNAIYEGGAEWRFSDGTTVKGAFTSKSGLSSDADAAHEAVSMDFYYIVRINARSALVSTMSRNVLLFARSTAAWMMRITAKPKKSFSQRKLRFTGKISHKLRKCPCGIAGTFFFGSIFIY